MQNRSRLAGIQYLVMMIVWIITGLLISVAGLDRFLNYYSAHSLVELELLVPEAGCSIDSGRVSKTREAALERLEQVLTQLGHNMEETTCRSYLSMIMAQQLREK